MHNLSFPDFDVEKIEFAPKEKKVKIFVEQAIGWSGRFRKQKGEMLGRRLVREWDPQTGLKRTWHETIDQSGNIRIVRPEANDGSKIHYLFDTNGIFEGTR